MNALTNSEPLDYSVESIRTDTIRNFHWKFEGRNLWSDHVYPLDEFDLDCYRHVPLKEGEVLVRYRTFEMPEDWKCLIKLNPDKNLIYFLDHDYALQDRAIFETKGVKGKIYLK